MTTITIDPTAQRAAVLDARDRERARLRQEADDFYAAQMTRDLAAIRAEEAEEAELARLLEQGATEIQRLIAERLDGRHGEIRRLERLLGVPQSRFSRAKNGHGSLPAAALRKLLALPVRQAGGAA